MWHVPRWPTSWKKLFQRTNKTHHPSLQLVAVEGIDWSTKLIADIRFAFGFEQNFHIGRIEKPIFQGRRHGLFSGGRIVGSVANLPPKYPKKLEKTPDLGRFNL